MSSTTKQLLLFLFICIFHVNRAFELESWAQFYSDKLGLKNDQIRKLEKFFTDNFHEVGNEFDKKYGKIFPECDHLIVHPNKYFIQFTETSQTVLMKICNVKRGLRKLFKMNPDCYSNLSGYIKDYMYTLFFDHINVCLNKEFNAIVDKSVSSENSLEKSVDSRKRLGSESSFNFPDENDKDIDD